MVSLTLDFFAPENAISAFPSKDISLMLNTLTDHGCSRVLPRFVIPGNAKRLDLYDFPRAQLLAAKFIFPFFHVYDF